MSGGSVSALYRHPVKGFTPEPLERASLRPGAGVAHDRIYAVEDGPSGFDPDAPAHVPKMRFTVLAKLPEVAKIRTRYDDATDVFHAEAPNVAPIAADLAAPAGRADFAAWLSDFFGDALTGPLRVIPAPGAHRFYDDPTGLVSAINLASIRDLERRLDRPVDPLRFRANFYFDGWPAWSELEAVGRSVTLGSAHARVVKPIRRCLATHVDPTLGVRDIDMMGALQREYGHALCGIYLHIEAPGDVRVGDAIGLAA